MRWIVIAASGLLIGSGLTVAVPKAADAAPTAMVAAATGCAPIYSIGPSDPDQGDVCDGQSPDTTGCAYLPGRVKVAQLYIPQYDVYEQMFRSSSCDGVAWTRLWWPAGNPGYGVDVVDVLRFGTADGGYTDGTDGTTAWWSNLIGAIPTDCITSDISIEDGSQLVTLPQMQDGCPAGWTD